MSMLIGTGVMFVAVTWYVGKKSWHALHRMVGITPGTMVYHNPQVPIRLQDLRLQQLNLDKTHLQSLSDTHLAALQRIDSKIGHYQRYYKDTQSKKTASLPTASEQDVIVHKLIHTRLPDMLRSYHLQHTLAIAPPNAEQTNSAEALLMDSLQGIEKQLDAGLQALQQKHMDDLRIMNRYIDQTTRS
ncbi:hypothetical protein [Psychrobacter aestuarii]|uniref:Uncharacterized protein n=1 Tax=Psychrobacter aestuarii TaxID=556327 RepID=A0ABP3FMX0_9GAMM|nr:hypothetical protein [Psychrobacter aestuarii]